MENHHNQKVNHVNQPFSQMTISQISHLATASAATRDRWSSWGRRRREGHMFGGQKKHGNWMKLVVSLGKMVV